MSSMPVDASPYPRGLRQHLAWLRKQGRDLRFNIGVMAMVDVLGKLEGTEEMPNARREPLARH